MPKFLATLFVLIFVVTGALVVVIDDQPKLLRESYKTIIFGSHMAGWMILGMVSNYLWDLFKSGKSLADIRLPNLLLPVLVSPIVFFGIWSIWKDQHQEISFALNLVAFQNGFFWQVVLSKVGPVIPPTVSGVDEKPPVGG